MDNNAIKHTEVVANRQPLFCPAFNKLIDLPTQPQKIVSLVPSQTELLFDLGLDDRVIGITKFCIHPNEWFRSKTRIGGTKDVDIEKIKSLNPDLIIANKEENIKQQIEALELIAPVWLTDVNTLDDALQMIEDIGQLTGTTNQSQLICDKIKAGFNNLKHETSNLQPNTACYLIWQNPYMTTGCDTFINSMLQQAGFQNIFADKERYPETSIDEIKARQPQFIFLSSEPYPFKQKHLDEIQAQVPQAKVLLVDGEMFSWYGSRLIASPKYFQKLMAVCMHKI